MKKICSFTLNGQRSTKAQTVFSPPPLPHQSSRCWRNCSETVQQKLPVRKTNGLTMCKDASRGGDIISVGVKATGRVLYFDTNVLLTVNMPFFFFFLD